jgi:hypothetical protein
MVRSAEKGLGKFSAFFFKVVKMRKRPNWDAFLDPGIAQAVKILNKFGIETFESCQGGEGHCYPEPTVRFHGDKFEGFKAFAIAKQNMDCLWPAYDAYGRCVTTNPRGHGGK